MCELVVLVGVPGAGKSTIGKKYAKEHNLAVVSSDELRKTIFGDVNNQEHNKLIFDIINRIVDELLRNEISVLVDATNTNKWSRKNYIKKSNFFDVKVSALVVHTSIETAKRRNAMRDRVVPDFVIDRMFKNFEMPTVEEGFEEVITIDNENDK